MGELPQSTVLVAECSYGVNTVVIHSGIRDFQVKFKVYATMRGVKRDRELKRARLSLGAIGDLVSTIGTDMSFYLIPASTPINRLNPSQTGT